MRTKTLTWTQFEELLDLLFRTQALPARLCLALRVRRLPGKGIPRRCPFRFAIRVEIWWERQVLGEREHRLCEWCGYVLVC